jgi:hypothetical protein
MVPIFNTLVHNVQDIVTDQASLIVDVAIFDHFALPKVVQDLTKMDKAILSLEGDIVHHNTIGEAADAGLVLDYAAQMVVDLGPINPFSHLAGAADDFFADIATLTIGVVDHPWEVWV